MNLEKQRIAIAEACGIARLWSTALPERTVHCDVPDYLNDLNAMHEAEKMLTNVQENGYITILCLDIQPEPKLFHATAAQRAEAFLRTIGKWEESA